MIKKWTKFFIAFLVLTAVVFPPSLVWGNPVVKTEKAVYMTGEKIKVLFSGAPGEDADWICIVPAVYPDTEAGDYKYTPKGQSQGILLFDSLLSGKYEVRAYFDYKRRGYAVSARYAFSVVDRERAGDAAVLSQKKSDPENVQNNIPAAGTRPLTTEKTVYRSGEKIRVLFSGAPGNDADWICIVPAGTPDTEAGDYKYMPKGLKQGFLAFDSPPAPGKYEARAYFDYKRRGYAVSARHAFSVVDQEKGNTDVALAEQQEPLPDAAASSDSEKQADSETAAAAPPLGQPEGTAAVPAPAAPAETMIVRQNIPPSGYTLEYAPIISQLTLGAFETALDLADKNYQKALGEGGAKQDRHLKLLERGKVALAARKYEQCIADLQEAEKRFLTIEGTVSIAEGLGSLVTDDTVQEYEPEMHEKLMIPPYLVLAYLGKGDFDGARVERNKTISRIHQYIEENPERAYLENPFARFLSAVVYEMEGKHDDAKIEYRKLKLEDEITRLTNKKEKATDLIVFVDAGMAPQKYEVKYGPATIIAGGGSVTLGFAYAGYNALESAITDCAVKVNGEAIGKTTGMYDLEKTVFDQYERNKSAMMAKLIARMTGKAAAQVAAQMAAEQALKNIPFGGLFAKVAIGAVSAHWIASEKADLRSWVTLPRQIQYLRISDLKPGEYTITIEYNGGAQSQKVVVEEGKIRIAYFSATR